MRRSATPKLRSHLTISRVWFGPCFVMGGAAMSGQLKYVLDETQIPTSWYNIVADLPDRRRRLHPGTLQPVGPDDRAVVPDGADPAGGVDRAGDRDSRAGARHLPLWRPTPLIRARRLEKALDTPAKIYFKYEGVSPAGSRTSRIPPWRRPITTSRRASSGSPPRPAQGNGARRWPLPARCSG